MTLHLHPVPFFPLHGILLIPPCQTHSATSAFRPPSTGWCSARDRLLLVIIACIIPDLPWIAPEMPHAPGIFHPYDLRLYCTAQASLLFCLVLLGGPGLLAPANRQDFSSFSAATAFFTCCSTPGDKWGNGVHLTAPFSWTMLHLDLIWPRHPVISASPSDRPALSPFRSLATVHAAGIQLCRPGGKQTGAGLGFLLFCHLLARPIFFLHATRTSRHLLPSIPCE